MVNRIYRAFGFVAAIALIFVFSSYSSPLPRSLIAQNRDLWQKLRWESGHVILLRHAETTAGIGDPAGFKLNDCSTQRNLSEAGRKQAITIGENFRQQKIPIAFVLSSQWCRCLDTAKLMNLGTVKPFSALNSFFGDRSTEEQQTAEVRQFIVQNRHTTGAIVMVTHQVNITALSGVVPREGEAVVVTVKNGDRLEVVGQFDPRL